MTALICWRGVVIPVLGSNTERVKANSEVPSGSVVLTGSTGMGKPLGPSLLKAGSLGGVVDWVGVRSMSWSMNCPKV